MKAYRMIYGAHTAHGFVAYDRRRSARALVLQAVFGAAAVALSVLAGARFLEPRPVAVVRAANAPTVQPAATVAANVYVELLDPTFSLGPEPVPFGQSVPLGTAFAARAPEAATAVAVVETVLSTPIVTALVESAPMPAPAPRPPEFRVPDARPAQQVSHPIAQQPKASVVAAAPTFFEKLFGPSRPSGPVLAYAAPEDGVLGSARRLTGAPAVQAERQTAVYNIAAHTVTLPDGTRLEAHSGLGNRLDDPRYVHEHMRGATPPHVYELTVREQLFHGVQAIRLNPVGGEGGVFGRTGLLAHTYMLGPNGDSNGCVSFRDYNAFLRAYMRGDVRRLVVVAGAN